MGRVRFVRRVAPFVVVAVAAMLVTLAAGPSALADNTTTTTQSTKRVTTTTRVDLEAAPAEVCDAPATEPVLIDQTSQDLVPTGTTNVDTLITHTTVVTQYFQATAPGPPCAVVVAARFTG